MTKNTKDKKTGIYTKVYFAKKINSIAVKVTIIYILISIFFSEYVASCYYKLLGVIGILLVSIIVISRLIIGKNE